jgi:uncharacterized protein
VKVAGTQQIPAPPERAFDMLLDPDVLSACIPGCQELVRVGEGEYRMKMKVALAAVSGDFTGTVKITEVIRPVSFQMQIEGSGRIGHLNGRGRMNLADAGAATTQLDYAGDVQVGGTMAAVGQRLIDAASKMLIRNFFSNLTREVQSH